MNQSYYGISKLQFDKYFDNLCIEYKDYVMELLDILSQKISFLLKLLSVQFHIIKETEPFAAFGFRKRKKERFFFVEFYSKIDIDDIRVNEKTQKEIIVNGKKADYIINLVKINKDKKIDNQIVKWIEEAYKLV
jgi:hypothetical protein